MIKEYINIVKNLFTPKKGFYVENNILYDNNNNSINLRHFNKSEALEMLYSLENCKNCHNCENLKNCHNCINIVNAENCINCVYSADIKNSQYLRFCHFCEDSKNLQEKILHKNNKSTVSQKEIDRFNEKRNKSIVDNIFKGVK